jgi:hypothetical protein
VRQAGRSFARAGGGACVRHGARSLRMTGGAGGPRAECRAPGGQILRSRRRWSMREARCTLAQDDTGREAAGRGEGSADDPFSGLRVTPVILSEALRRPCPRATPPAPSRRISRPSTGTATTAPRAIRRTVGVQAARGRSAVRQAGRSFARAGGGACVRHGARSLRMTGGGAGGPRAECRASGGQILRSRRRWSMREARCTLAQDDTRGSGSGDGSAYDPFSGLRVTPVILSEALRRPCPCATLRRRVEESPALRRALPPPHRARFTESWRAGSPRAGCRASGGQILRSRRRWSMREARCTLAQDDRWGRRSEGGVPCVWRPDPSLALASSHACATVHARSG